MALLDFVADENQFPMPVDWLYRCADGSPFAFAHGEEFIRWADHTRWARLCDDWLISERSGARLAYWVGNLLYDAESHAPFYSQPAVGRPPRQPPIRGDRCGAGTRTLRARTARRTFGESRRQHDRSGRRRLSSLGSGSV